MQQETQALSEIRGRGYRVGEIDQAAHDAIMTASLRGSSEQRRDVAYKMIAQIRRGETAHGMSLATMAAVVDSLLLLNAIGEAWK